MSRGQNKVKDIAINLGLVFTSVLVTLFLFDGALGFLGYPSENPPKISHPANFQEVRDNIEFRYEFRTNSQGLRYREVPLEKTLDAHRVMVVGDSFTEGFGVEEGERFTDRLERLYSHAGKRVLFINGGLSNTGPLRHGRLFKHVGLKYNLDALLICIYPNDLIDTPDSATGSQIDVSASSRDGVRKLVHALWPRIYILLKSIRDRREQQQRTRTRDFIANISRTAAQRGIPQ